MSTGSRTQMASIPGNESTRDTDASHGTQHSALLYLFQEVSKLASPINDTLSGTNSWLSDATRGAAIARADEEDTDSQNISSTTCQHGLPHAGHNCQEDKAKDKRGAVAAVVQSHVEGNSPWRVLSLINLQCERLLHHTDAGEPDRSFDSSCAKLSHPVNRLPSAITNVSDQRSAGVCISVECTLGPSLSGREEEETPPGFGPAQGTCSTEVECSVKNSTLGCHVRSKSAAQLDTCRPVPVEENTPAASQTRCRDPDVARVPSSESPPSQTAGLPNAPSCVCQIFHSSADASVALPVGTLASDHNANLVLIAAPPCDAQRHPLSVQRSPLLIGASDICQQPAVPSDRVAASTVECTSASADAVKGAGACLTSSISQPSAVQTERDAGPHTAQQRTKTPRKQPHPSRSVDIRDPDFQGVTFRIDAELDDSREQCRLLITSKYSKQLRKSARKPRPRTRTSQKSCKTGSSDEECDQTTTSVFKGKVCASCGTRKTPMWRDAEDGTPLCNACGIRYKKYRIRCISCWHIPRKEGNSSTRCMKCGGTVRLTSALRKHFT